METTIELDPNDGVFELPGTEPAWISVHTCPTPKCACRSALVLACTEGRDVLLESHAAVRDAWVAGAGYADVASQLDGVDVFQLDIDTAEVTAPASGEPLDLAGYPAARSVVERLEGELLDAIGRLWYRGKGWPDPEVRALRAPEIAVHGWRPGDMLAWNDVLEGVRQDYYLLDDRLYEASELYCSVLDCQCGEVVIAFETRTPRGAPSPGRVAVQRSGTAKIEPIGKARDLLERLWDVFRNRHPSYLERFARRYSTMKEIGARVVTKPPARSSPKVGRNALCPCGSGKKFKKCCGSGEQ